MSQSKSKIHRIKSQKNLHSYEILVTVHLVGTPEEKDFAVVQIWDALEETVGRMADKIDVFLEIAVVPGSDNEGTQDENS